MPSLRDGRHPCSASIINRTFQQAAQPHPFLSFYTLQKATACMQAPVRSMQSTLLDGMPTASQAPVVAARAKDLVLPPAEAPFAPSSTGVDDAHLERGRDRYRLNDCRYTQPPDSRRQRSLCGVPVARATSRPRVRRLRYDTRIPSKLHCRVPPVVATGSGTRPPTPLVFS